jgi:MoaA/NifB/PqqE/SkfB family radical SAM enzyme
MCAQFKMRIDPQFQRHFRDLKQVFLYLIDECNLRCSYCLYKPNLMFKLGNKEIELETVLTLITDLRKLGASKLTIMGGEPTLYGAAVGNRPLLEIISTAKKLGYEYVRLDTNGIFETNLLLREDFRKLDEITFSLDGPNAEVNDAFRGKGTFDKCISNVKSALKLGYKVDITSCVHRANVERDEEGNLILDSLIKFVTTLGVNRINFHPIFKMKVPRDTWTGETDIQPSEWIKIREEISQNIATDKYNIQVRIPQRFIVREAFERNREYYGYCSAKLGERVLIHPDGIIRICALLIGTPYGVAKFYDGRILWDRSPTNELRRHELNSCTPCANQVTNNGDLVPLCISLKENQDEFIWKEKLDWEARKHKTEN